MEAIERFFPLKKAKKKSTNPPWMSKAVLKEIDARKKLYREDGGIRTEAWKEAKKRTDKLVKERKDGYMETQKEHLLAEYANRNFYKHVRNFGTVEWPKQFDICELFC